MAKDPAILFYTSDFMVGVSFLTMEERGKYITALCILHQHGGKLPLEKIEIVTGKLSNILKEKFMTDGDGLYYNDRLLKESERRRVFCESRRNSARTRYIRSAYAGRMENENVNENVNVSKEENINIKGDVEHKRKERQHRGVKYDFGEIWDRYPRKIGRKDAERHFNASVKTDQDYEDIKAAIGNYLDSDSAKSEMRYIKHGSAWFYNWRDWIVNPESISEEEKTRRRIKELIS